MQALCHHRFPTNPRRSGRRSGSGIPLLSNQFVMMGSPRPARWGEYVRRRRAVREARAGTYAGDARAVRNTPVLGEPVDLQRQAPLYAARGPELGPEIRGGQILASASRSLTDLGDRRRYRVDAVVTTRPDRGGKRRETAKMVLDQLNTKQSTRIKLRERVTRAPAPISRVSG